MLISPSLNEYEKTMEFKMNEIIGIKTEFIDKGPLHNHNDIINYIFLEFMTKESKHIMTFKNGRGNDDSDYQGFKNWMEELIKEGSSD